MGIFRNQNESAFVGGRKHFADVIKNTAPPDVLFWQNAEEDFNAGSTLIVAESEEALFFNNGVIEAVFPGGRYILSTQNFPFISRLRNALTGGVSSFNCKVYFVRTADSQEIRWGTTSPIPARDKMWGLRTNVSARGAYKVRIVDSKRFLVKMVGNNVPYLLADEFSNYFQSIFSEAIRSILAKCIQEYEGELIELSAYQDEFARKVAPRFQEILTEYGIQLVYFSIEAIDIPDDDPLWDQINTAMVNQRTQRIQAGTDADVQRLNALGSADALQAIAAAEAAAQRMAAAASADATILQAQGDAQAMDTLGDRWARQQSAEILRDLANNEGAGGIAAAGAGIGMGMAAGGVFNNLAQGMFSQFSEAPQQMVGMGGVPTTGRSRFVQENAGAPQQPQQQQPQQGQYAQQGAAPMGDQPAHQDGANAFAAAANAARRGQPDGAAPQGNTACPGCGAVVAPGARFCSLCGTQIGG